MRDKFSSWTQGVRDALSALASDKLYLVGVSGGMDSCVLLDLLLASGFRNLVVCHFNHRLRGTDSDEDAAFVSQMAVRHGLAFQTGTAPDRSARKGNAMETVARAARLAFFAEAARSHGTNELFLAHHADDQVETFIFRLLRGTASLGHAGMLARTVLRVGNIGLIIHRPLLAAWRADLFAYANVRGLAWRNDATNAEPVTARNRVRHELIPLAESIMGRRIKPALLRCLQISQEEDVFLDGVTPGFWQRAELPVDHLRQLPVALQRRVVHRWLRRLGVPDVGAAEVEATRKLATTLHPARISLPGGTRARRRQGKIFLESPATRGPSTGDPAADKLPR
jgi:tRNA(Ile)-lysidine synthase